MKNRLTFFMVLFTTLLFAQDYNMFETHYLTPKQGHEQALAEEIAEHNKLYHADGPYSNFVTTVMNGPRTGDYVFAMGPCTFTQLDDRPSSAEHDADWASVMLHAHRIDETQYWRQHDETSFAPETTIHDNAGMRLVRFYDVADGQLFIKVQGMIVEALKGTGSTRRRTMYRRAFPSDDGNDWATVSPYNSWSELDADEPAFRERFESTHGADSWDPFVVEYRKAVNSRRTEWRAVQTDLMGSGE